MACREQARPKEEAKIDRLLSRLPLSGEMAECAHPLFEACDGLTVCPSFDRPRTGLPQITHRLFPHLALKRMVCQLLDMSRKAVSVELFKCLDDPCVKGSSAVS